MANESNSYTTKAKEEKKLVKYYDSIFEDADCSVQQKFILQIVSTKIAQLEPKVDHTKLLRNVLSIGVMLLSGVATVVLGLKLTSDNWWTENASNVALAVTATATLLSGISALWNLETYWLRNKVMLNKLKELRYEIAFALQGEEKADDKKLKVFLDRLVGVLGDEYWERMLKEEGEKAKVK